MKWSLKMMKKKFSANFQGEGRQKEQSIKQASQTLKT